MKLNYFTDVTLFFNIIPKHPEVLISFWHCLHKCHGRN